MPKAKLSKDTILNIIICAVLSIMLVLSITLTFTGAWFTDSDSAGSSLNLRFASVNAEPITASVNTYIYPGREISYHGGNDANDPISYTGDVNAYYRMKITVTNVDNPSTALTEQQLTDIKSQLRFTSLDSVASNAKDGNLYGKFVVGTNPQITIPAGIVKFSEDAGNEYQTKQFKIVLVLDVIQAGNIEGAVPSVANLDDVGTTAAQKLAIYQTLFAYYDNPSGNS